MCEGMQVLMNGCHGWPCFSKQPFRGSTRIDFTIIPGFPVWVPMERCLGCATEVIFKGSGHAGHHQSHPCPSEQDALRRILKKRNLDKAGTTAVANKSVVLIKVNVKQAPLRSKVIPTPARSNGTAWNSTTSTPTASTPDVSSTSAIN